ncbi:tellurium resistance protein, partial [Streptomyces sp. SID6013]|nr:tellurium resistance protein [Streptomyces sp. SID6013]
MAMWDKIKDQAKTFQQSQGARGASGSGQGSHG